MGFWKKLFKRKEKETQTEAEWDQIVYARENVDFDDEEQRSRYVTNCVEQIAEATRETELLTGEYSLVTSYLMDMEEVEALPEGEREELEKIARALLTLEQEQNRYNDRKNRMSDTDFYEIRGREKEMEEGILKLKEGERQASLIKQDLTRIDRERHAYAYRRQELSAIQANLRGMTVIFLTALIICLMMLAVLQFAFEMNTMAGYFVSVLAAAIAITVLCVKNMDARKEEDKLIRSINKLIQLQNKVKIRYVNNSKLLDYLYIKYNTDSASKLERLWERYKQEKEERRQFLETEEKLDMYQERLVAQLSRYHIRDPHRWIHQVAAILDSREMVELRHDLILRRQALREQLDYNKDVAETAHKEILDIVDSYPQYAVEILEMVERYQYV
ncbi:MAG: hypothetical protein NC081_07135 [Roseburia sp.]|nr:hypothetical protein [Roseburia sp.]